MKSFWNGRKTKKGEQMTDESINELIKIVLKSADYGDDCELIDNYLSYIGLGKIPYSRKLRSGVKGIIDLIKDNASLKYTIDYLQDCLKEYEEFNDKIMDVNDIDLLTDEEKERVKKFIEDIFEEKE